VQVARAWEGLSVVEAMLLLNCFGCISSAWWPAGPPLDYTHTHAHAHTHTSIHHSAVLAFFSILVLLSGPALPQSIIKLKIYLFNIAGAARGAAAHHQEQGQGAHHPGVRGPRSYAGQRSRGHQPAGVCVLNA